MLNFSVFSNLLLNISQLTLMDKGHHHGGEEIAGDFANGKNN